MGSNEIFTLLFFVSMCLFWTSEAGGKFYVGGKDGWVMKPSEGYDKWAEKLRFQIGDTLVFKYKKGQDSVLVVNETDFNSCNIQSPIEKLDDDGNTKFTIKDSGLIHFISGNQENCKNGEKLAIRVLSPRPPNPPNAPETPKPSPPQAPGSHTPSPSSPPPANDHKTPSLPKSSAPVSLKTSSMRIIVGFSFLATLMV